MLSLSLRLKLIPKTRIPIYTSTNNPSNRTVHIVHFPFLSPKRRFPTLATKNDNDNDNDSEPKKEANDGEAKGSDGGDETAGKENRRWILDGIRWRDLVLSPDPDNVVAVGLTGLLTWASVQVLWQLVFISLAILVAAVKYCLIAALLIFILITLL